MFRRDEDEVGLVRLTSWAVRNRVEALKEEFARPWRGGDLAPEAEVGRRVGLGLALGALLFGLGLAIVSIVADD